MVLEISEATRRQARLPHELAMVNLVVVNLALCGGILASTLARKGSTLEHFKLMLVMLPLLASLAIIAWSALRSAKTRAAGERFVALQWSIAARRNRILLMAYLAVAALTGIGWLLSRSAPALQEVMFIALVRVAVAPLLITVMVLAVLESSALFQTIRGEVPDDAGAGFRPPPDTVPPGGGV